MITFSISIVLLILGYIFYGRVVEKLFGSDPNRITPAYYMQDGVDFIPMKSWKIFMIQFLNIAGLGPIFGAIMGAKFGSASFLWIVFGSIFAGGVHDYIAGMISLRNDGASLAEIHGKYLGKGVKQFMRAFLVVLMVVVGVVFVVGPAGLLAKLTPDHLDATFWIVVILIYYLLATLLPIDKIIGKVYPIFGFCLIFMALGILVAIYVNQPDLPEIWEGLGNKMPNAESNPIFPMMFISIACGAISGFHATQSPLMARCMTNEKLGRPVFYGAMITEGLVALIWAAAASDFFFNTDAGYAIFLEGGNPAIVIDSITKAWLGKFGAVLAVLGVIFAPISTGDTAFRSARLLVADFLHYDQKPIYKRLVISIPLFIAGFGILMYSIKDADGFDTIWRYFSWSNQLLAVVTLWAVTVFLVQEKKFFYLTLLPALFMTMVCSTFIFISEREGFGLDDSLSYVIGGGITLLALSGFIIWKIRYSRNRIAELKNQ